MLFAVSLVFCSGTQQTIKDNTQDNTQDDTQNIIEPPIEREYNFKFTGYDINIDDPEKDRRSYYIIKIDKIEVGRTTIGLESQEKIFEYNLSGNRHLLMVEKWALDGKKGKYVKLNNIEQPKPAFTYFTLPEEKTASNTLENDPAGNQAVYNLVIEE
jgi:hypothetical protein